MRTDDRQDGVQALAGALEKVMSRSKQCLLRFNQFTMGASPMPSPSVYHIAIKEQAESLVYTGKSSSATRF